MHHGFLIFQKKKQQKKQHKLKRSVAQILSNIYFLKNNLYQTVNSSFSKFFSFHITQTWRKQIEICSTNQMYQQHAGFSWGSIYHLWPKNKLSSAETTKTQIENQSTFHRLWKAKKLNFLFLQKVTTFDIVYIRCKTVCTPSHN